MPNSTYLDGKLNKLMWGNTAFAPPATVYAALSTTLPAADGTGVTEPVGNGYARVAVTNNNVNWVAQTAQPATGQGQANGTATTWPLATGAWGTVTYVCFYDAAAGGNFLGWQALTTAQVVVNGDTVSFAAQALTIQLV